MALCDHSVVLCVTAFYHDEETTMRIFVAIIAGLLFGFGMGLSQMMDPARAIAFMDITGVWDPTLSLCCPARCWLP